MTFLRGGGPAFDSYRFVDGADPGAGAEISVVVPAGETWQVVAIRFPFVTSAVVASRVNNLSITDGTTEFMRLPPSTVQAANLTWIHTWAAGVGDGQQNGTVQLSQLPEGGLLLPPGFVIATVTGNFDAGDNYGAPRITLRN